jgi:hypothetical protein
MPKKSYFIGFDPPTDDIRWKQAIKDAASGKQILLKKVNEQIKSFSEIVDGDINFKWVHRFSDAFIHDFAGFKHLNLNATALDGRVAPITLLGYHTYEYPNFMGRYINYQALSTNKLIEKYQSTWFKLPKKIVAVGGMNENWGFLSTHILNRTCNWGLTLAGGSYKVSQTEQMKPFLDDPNLVMLVVNQHHNVRAKTLGLALLTPYWFAGFSSKSDLVASRTAPRDGPTCIRRGKSRTGHG